MTTLATLLAAFNANPPIEPRALHEVGPKLEELLPEDYKRFVCTVANGGEGFIGTDAYVILWRAEELLSLNVAYEVDEYAPGLFLFGSNGGGEAFAFDIRSPDRPVVSVPFVGMALTEARHVASTFHGFLERLYSTAHEDAGG